MKLASRAALAVAAIVTMAPHALATDQLPAQPVVVHSVGPKALRVRIAAFTTGFVFPCSSSSNTQLFEGSLEPGGEARVSTPAGCVCVQHTYDDFPESNWSMGLSACRPLICEGYTRARRCRLNPDPTIRVSVSSKVPGNF